MNVAELVPLIAAVCGLLGGGGVFIARATVKAARETAAATATAAVAQAAPAARQADLAILEATVQRVDDENREIRTEMKGMRALQRAYSWTVDRLIRRMEDTGNPPEPEDIHPLVREHMQTGA